MKCLTSILHSADITANAKDAFPVEPEKSTDVDTVAVGADLRRELSLRLGDEKIAYY
jgi:hypothetical protein